MTDPRSDAADIAWLRNLAEEGAKGPTRGASIMMAAGLIFGGASLIHWAAASGLTPGGMALASTVWLGATVLYLVVMTVLIVRQRGQAVVRTAANRAMAAAWACIGMGIFALFASLFVNDLTSPSHLGTAVFALVPSIIMVFYGVGWGVTAAMVRSPALWGLAAASFIAAPLLTTLSGDPLQYLAYAACLFGLMALPAFLLMRAAKQG